MNRMVIKMVKWLSVTLVAVLLLGACSKDDDSARLWLESDTLFLDGLGKTGVVRFSTEFVKSVSIPKPPAGWTTTADLATGTITVTAPAALGGEAGAVRSGTVSVLAYGIDGYSTTARLFVAVTDKKDISDARSNSMIVSQPYTEYTFDAIYKGESSEQIPTADVQVIWQTDMELVKFPIFRDGKFSFYIDGDSEGALTEGNALLGAYSGAGELLWTWHLWIVDAADIKEQTYANGTTFMSINLGALGNTNKTNDEILASFGLFYQWGRRTPFAGPRAYDAAKAEDHYLYDAGGRRIALAYVASTPETGTEAYAAAYPMSFILGVEESSYDWLYAAHSEALWADKKTLNDPCPKGWRVPSKGDFALLRIVDVASGREADYGWDLTDGSVTAYYPGAGFRPYLTGRIQNVYNPLEGVDVPKPWIGYYWTNGTNQTRSSSMYFWINAADPIKSGVLTSDPQYRANGMQVRCVRDE